MLVSFIKNILTTTAQTLRYRSHTTYLLLNSGVKQEKVIPDPGLAF
jgi:hypothetical protein